MNRKSRALILLTCCCLLASLFLITAASQANPAGDDPLLQFSEATYTIPLSQTTIPVTVTLDQPSAVFVEVYYTTQDGTALAGTDYISASGTLLIDPNYVQESFNVHLVQPAAGGQRELSLHLSDPVNAALGAQSSATVTFGEVELPITATPEPDDPPGIQSLFLPVLIKNRPYTLTGRLLNPGFEEGYDESHPTYNDEWRDNILTPNHWLAWWEEEDHNILYHMDNPEIVPIEKTGYYVEPVLRVHSGQWAYKMIKPWGNYHAGFLQVIENLPPGSIAEFSYYAHAWCCFNDPPPPLSCAGDDHFWFRAGIDPTGGTDPWSADVVWSEAYYIFDYFEQVGPLQAVVGAEGKVTVYIAAHTLYPYKFNDAYVDTAEFTVRVY